MDNYIPIKIMERKWAERLMMGEVFIRPLSEFSSIDRIKNQGNLILYNDFRGDLLEGAFKIICDSKQDEVFSQLPLDMQMAISGGALIDVSLGPCNLFCLYRMTYNQTTGRCNVFDDRILQFGDSAVIIRDFNAFLFRLYKSLQKTYPAFFIMFDEIEYYEMNSTKRVTPLFSKESNYKWQNEARIVVGILDREHPLKNGEFPLQCPPKQVTLKIGDIHDIASLVSLDQLMKGQIVFDEGFSFAMDSLFNTPYYIIKRDTKNRLDNYQPCAVKPIFWI